MKVNFKLRKGKKTNTILIDFRLGRDVRVRRSTGVEIKSGSEKYWDAKKCKIKIPNDITNFLSINEQLRTYEGEIEEAIIKLKSDGRVSSKTCEKAIKQVLKLDNPTVLIKKNKSNIVLDYFDWYLGYYKINNSSYTKKPLTRGTLKTYNNSRNYLKRYLEYKKINTFYFEDIDQNFYNDFINFGYQNNYTINYIGTTIQKLKTIIAHACEENVHTNKEFEKRYFAKLEEDINHPYLNEQELEAITNVELNNTLENNVRDIFLIGANTGLRVGDLVSFLKTPKLIQMEGKKFINLKQIKTGKEVLIPINSKIQNILKKRDGKFPPAIHQNIINKLIKSIARKAEIKEKFAVEKTISGKKTKQIKPKCEFISTHTARRSFCTNTYNAGMAPHNIMVMSGHKSEKVFYNYIKASLKSKALQVSEHSFFN